MKRLKHSVRCTAAVLAVLTLSCSASARALTVTRLSDFCFTADDFTTLAADDGVFITAVPASTIATVRYGDRILHAGDALPKDALNQLTLDATCVTGQDVTIGYYTVAKGTVTGAKELKLSILPKQNQPPTAENGTLETYKNIANTGTFTASDPEGGALTYALVKEPKRGTVELHEDGTFTYTPKENKVGKDSFTYSVTDDAGNTSEPAKISIEIKKPSDKAVYADMTSDPDAFSAMWLKDQGLFTGSVIGGNLCFEPDKAVSRGEFLVMVMKLVEAPADEAQMTSGFADEAQTPVWLQPYIVSALSNGMISGVHSDSGVVFRPTADLSRAEAAVMLQNILQLPVSSTQAVFAAEADEEATPAWAMDAAAALSSAGIHMENTSQAESITRRDVAKLLYQVNSFLDEDVLSTFYWVQ